MAFKMPQILIFGLLMTWIAMTAQSVERLLDIYPRRSPAERHLPCATPPQALGLENGKIRDSQLTQSSVWPWPRGIYSAAKGGRLNSKLGGGRGDAWRPFNNLFNRFKQWFQVDLGRKGTVTAIGTQGRDRARQWVKSYVVSYSDDGIHFTMYKQNGRVKLFRANTDQRSIVKNELWPVITARFIRIHPRAWNQRIAMRVELYGCPSEPRPCDSSPCKNAAICTIKGDTYSCKCHPYFIGANCETELPNPCRPNPCKNGGQCEVLGNGFGCRCKPEFGGPTCEYEQSTCSAQGDPHYRSFDGLAFDFQGGCDYIFAQDCGSDKPGKVYTVVTKNTRCGWGRVTCVSAVTIYLAGYKIALSRAPRTAVINGVRLTTLPITRPGFVINNPSGNYLSLSTNVGLSVIWDSRSTLKVTVSGMFKGKTCGLCGNNNGNRGDDRIGRNLKCAPKPEELLCTETAQTKPIIAKCQLLMSSGSPFASCHAAVNPADFMHDCKYDACRCTNPMQCVCSSFAAYTKKCSGYGKIIDWRFAGTLLYKPLEQCAKTCFNDGEIFTECGSSLARTCRDLSNNPIKASEECVPGCQCPKGQLLTDAGRCVSVADCPCHFEGKTVQPGESVDVGNCKTCTCNNGVMACVDDRKCNGKDPCESFPCKNNGICTSEGDSFSCDCSGDYQGRTCEELKPQPCDSSPCKNGGICTNLGSSFTCRCFANFIGATCETELPNPCEPNPCKNGGKCHVLGNGFGCRCKPQFGGPLCEQGQSQCLASGDPHYTSFDGFKFDFQGACDYIFAQDCGFGKPGKVFSVVTKNVRCGGRTTCVAAVTIYIPGYIIKFSRARSTAIVNGVRMTAFPITRPGFVIRSPGPVWLILNTDTGLTVAWNSKTTIKVTVSGKYKGKTCGLCGNNNGNRHDDRLGRQKCAPAPSELMCTPSFTAQQQMNKCDLMKNPASPFAKCFSIVDSAKIINDCKYDACRCTDPIQCVCASFATYTKKCSGYGKIINWRYAETFLYKPLEQCAQTCKNPGEIFTECGSSLVLTCRDLSRDIPVKSCEECIPGCQCPSGKVYNDKGECVPVAECPCHYEGKIVQPGDSVNVGNCKTCTCNKGAMKCVDDRECGTKDPCESFPCKNEGTCSSKGDSFVCECIGDYQGTTCEELKPQPCDSSPCKNGGVCTNEGDSFSCECEGYFQGTTCSEPKLKPCDSSPCKNGATCTNDENVFTCKCPPKFVGATCEKEVPNPCKPNPCKNGGKCEVVGNKYSCRCKPTFGGPNCEYGQTTCEAHGDPHYTTFDNAKFNFQGVCDYVFAQDCSDKKAFTVVTKNMACGPRAASCTSAVTVRFGDYEIKMTRAKRTAIINGVKVTKFPIRRPGFVITNPTKTWLRLTTEIGLTVNWNCKTIIRVSISGQYKGKTCGLCGNNDGSKENDKVDPNLECAPKPGELECKPTEVTKPQIDKCDLMSNPSSPFAECHSVIDPTDLVKDCKYDTCRCEDPVECLCSAFASYTKQCSSNAKIINWRFAGTFLYKPLEQCAKQCNNEGEIFNECGSSCAQTCRDLSRDIRCTEECVPGCQCPRGQVLDNEDRCVLVENCPCPYEGGMIPPGESVSVGNCKTCTCNAGAMECVDDRECGTTDPCESFPCKNEGICRSKGGSFSCDCVGDFVGETCEVAKPHPCDSSPCKNGGVCTNKGDSFSCECEGYFEGKTCEKTKPKPCDSSPCKNGGKCTNKEDSFSCQCPEDYQGETCEEPKAKPCDSSPCKNGGECTNRGDSFSCKCLGDYKGKTCEELKKPEPCDSSPCENEGTCENQGDNYICKCAPDYFGRNCKGSMCKDGKLDMLFVVDGSGSVRKGNFQKIKDFTKELSGRFNIGKDKTRVGFLQFGSKDKTRYEFRLGRKNTLAELDSAIDRITFLRSRSATGDALNRARNQVFTGKNGDRWNVGDVLILFTDGQTTEKDKTTQLEEAKKLKEQGVMIIAVVAGKQKSNEKLREALKKMASRAPGGDEKLEFEAGFGDLDDIANFLIKESCKGQKCEEDEVVAKCDSSCALTCSDLSRNADCGEGCGMRCRCPKGLLFHDKQRSCVPVSHCPCLFEGKEYNPGEEVSVGKCRTCTCKNGKMECEDKEDCFLEPCDSSPCKNGGSCTNDGDSFSCSCTDDFEGEICSKPKPKPCDSSPCENEGICTNEDDTFSCKCPDDFEGETCSEAKCEDTKLDLLLVVDGSGSVRKANFAKVKEFIKKLNEKFDVGPAKTRIALLQFGEPVKTKIEFNLDDKKTVEDVNKGVDDMQYLRSQTATGDALRKAREEVFNGKDGDRPDAPNVLILFTDGQATDKGGKNVQVVEAQKLKDEGVKVITVGMGMAKTINKFRSKLQEMASKVSGSDERLQFEADFDNLENIANTLVEEACDKNASV